MPFQALPTQNLQKQYIGFLAQNAVNANLGALTTYNKKGETKQVSEKENKKMFWTWKRITSSLDLSPEPQKQFLTLCHLAKSDFLFQTNSAK